eukprot:9311934-Karenia_brevis.AAC.1
MDESDITVQVNQSKWEKLQEKIKKRSAEQNLEERPAQQARTHKAQGELREKGSSGPILAFHPAQGEKRAAEATPDDEMATPQKKWR